MSEEYKSQPSPDDVSLKKIILNIKDFCRYLSTRWKSIVIFIIVGCLLGGTYSFFSKKLYVAEANFVFEDSDNGDSGGLALLGMGEEQASLFQGDNLIWLYKSQSMLQKTLMAEVDSSGKKKLLINWLIDLDDKISGMIKDLKEQGQPVTFGAAVSPDSLSLFQSKVLLFAIKRVRTNYLEVENVNKTMGIISVRVKATNELFAKNFVDHIVASVNSYYVQTKTKKTAEQVNVLEQKVAEFDKSMNKSMYQAASALDQVPYANPSLQSLKVSSQYKTVDVQVSSTMYAQMTQQLEMAKINLAKETPLIQVIDAPVLPLPTQKSGLILCIILGAVLATIFSTIGLLFKWTYSNIMNANN